MTVATGRLLLVDDNPEDRMIALRDIRRDLPGIEAVEVTDSAEFDQALGEQEFDAVITDYHLHWSTGLEVLAAVRRRWPETPVIMYTGSGTEEVAAAATRAGLFDYVVKTPRHRVRLATAVRTAMESSFRRRELKTTEDLFRIMFEQNLSGLYLGTMDGRLVDCNPEFARMFGYDSPEEVRGLDATSFVANPTAVEEGRRLMVERGGVLTNVEALARRKDGSVFHALYSARIYDAVPPGLVVATLTDVTEPYRAREDLRRAAVEWRTTFDGISSPIVLVRPDTSVIRVNAAGRALAGHDYPAIIGQPLGAISSREPWRSAAELTATAGAHAGPLSATVRDPESRSTWEISAFPAGAPGQPDRVVSLVLRDITEVVDLQESVVRNQTMSALGQLIAGVAHEVRSPLFGISATLDAFEARYGQEPTYRTYLDNLRREISRMNDLMRDLLELGRPATTPRRPERIGAIVAECIESCRTLAATHQVALQASLSQQAADALIMADRRRLLQVFENLVRNAIQHAPVGTTVTIAAQAQPAPASDIVLRVLDEGRGFRAEDLPRVFEPFYTRRAGGTGLGLAIVLRILEDHGGSVVAENRPEGGAAVCITLPVQIGGVEGE